MLTIAKLNESPGGEEQPIPVQSEMLEPAIPTMTIAKRICMNRTPQI